MRTWSPRDPPPSEPWAGCADVLDRLTQRDRAPALVAEGPRETPATMPDREHLPPWPVNQLLSWEAFDLPPREWRTPEPDERAWAIG